MIGHATLRKQAGQRHRPKLNVPRFPFHELISHPSREGTALSESRSDFGGGTSPATSGGATAVFLSYASQDVETARRICEALRGAGIEVWFDQSELRGADVWDRKIRRQIRDCSLFIPLISSSTQERTEGYFRREWKLAVDRTHDMADHVAFLMPIVIEGISERDAHVPDAFFRVQWSRLATPEVPPALIQRVTELLHFQPTPATAEPFAGGSRPPQILKTARIAERRTPLWIWAGAAAVILGGVLLFVLSNSAGGPGRAVGWLTTPRKAASTAAREKSLAVLPFANPAGDKDNDRLVDGIHEDITTSLGRIRDLHVISRTSVLKYRDPGARDLRKIGEELEVAALLEGSVKRIGENFRVNLTLTDARTGELLWAELFDRNEKQVYFELQREVSQEIARTLKAKFTRTEQALLTRRPTQDPVAYELYLAALVGEDVLTSRSKRSVFEEVAAGYEQAIARDATFARPYARLSALHGQMYFLASLDPTPVRRALAATALKNAERLDASAPETSYARGAFAYFCENDWERALTEFRAAEAGLPNDAQLLTKTGLALRRAGRFTEALQALERAADLNPHDLYTGTQLMISEFALRRYATVRDAARRFETLNPNTPWVRELAVRAQYALDGDRAAHVRAWAESPRAFDDTFGLLKDYQEAFAAGNLETAARVLDDRRFTPVPGLDLTIKDPVTLHRAMVAFLRNDLAAAKTHADSAIASYIENAARWTPRQEPLVKLGLARAHAYAGRKTEAEQEMKNAQEIAMPRDPYMTTVFMPFEFARIWVSIGRPEEALAALRAMFTGPSAVTPSEIRHDPFFKKLSEDPRLEEILRTAKPL